MQNWSLQVGEVSNILFHKNNNKLGDVMVEDHSLSLSPILGLIVMFNNCLLYFWTWTHYFKKIGPQLS